MLLGLSCAATARAPASCQLLVRLARDLGAGLAATGCGRSTAQPSRLGTGRSFWPVRLMLPASAFASALLDWWTLPSSPGLRTRIPTAVLLGLSCRATAPASADWPLELSWPATCVPEPLCDWSIVLAGEVAVAGQRVRVCAVGLARRCRRHPGSAPGSRQPCCSACPAPRRRGRRRLASCCSTGPRPGCRTGSHRVRSVTGAAVPPWDWSIVLAGEVDVAGQCVRVCAVGLVDVAVVAGAEDADPDGGVARLVLQGDRAGLGRLAARVVLARDLRARAALRLVDRSGR